MKKIPIMYDKFCVISLHVRKTHFNKNHASILCMAPFVLVIKFKTKLSFVACPTFRYLPTQTVILVNP